VIVNCLNSIFAGTQAIDFEVIVSDNGSTDGSLAYLKEHFPQVRLIENGTNLGYGKGNNVGIRLAQGEYILLLNPDTVVREYAFETLVTFADHHPSAGGYGCRVLNPDGSFQGPARPLPTVRGLLIAALGLRWLGHLSPRFASDTYPGWDGRTERTVGYQCGCCIMFRGDVLRNLGGFDESFFWNFDESDLCFRSWKSGWPILFCPDAEITHLGKQSNAGFLTRNALEDQRSLYRYFYKHHGEKSLSRVRSIALLNLCLRRIAYGTLNRFKQSQPMSDLLKTYRVLFDWHYRLRPLEFVKTGREPDVGYHSPTSLLRTTSKAPSELRVEKA
jgi:GT2 family glycosyltransferase